MQDSPKGVRLHIGIYGRRNVGKSSLLNALTGQEAAIVSPVPGTTTDVVSKPMELKPLGPVLFLDTAGLDDAGELGVRRMAKTASALERTDLAFLVASEEWGAFEDDLLAQLRHRNIATVVVLNKADLGWNAKAVGEGLRSQALEVVEVSCLQGTGLEELRLAVVRQAPKEFLDQPPILADLVGPSDLVLLVVPIDLEAPKGRLILPQVQIIREILDCDAQAIVVKERELSNILKVLAKSPDLVITDSQAMLKVAGDVPDRIRLTSFSVLFARWKGDLETFVRGVGAVDQLRSGDRVLVLEACTHHPIGDDIARVKIPRWLRQYTGCALEFDYATGHDCPAELAAYRLILHCGACMTNRREVLQRILAARRAGVPITNYGLVIAKSLGLLPRILSPFPGLQSSVKS